MGEAGPEAIMPLRRDASVPLGCQRCNWLGNLLPRTIMDPPAGGRLLKFFFRQIWWRKSSSRRMTLVRLIERSDRNAS